MIKKIYAIALALCVLSCNNINKKDDTERAFTIPVSFADKDNILPLSEFIDSVSFIVLETNKQCLIGNVDKIITISDGYLIIDKEIASKIFYFNKEGNFIASIGDKGNSRSEYINLEDVTTDGKIVYVLDSRGRKIVCYSLTGEYLDSYPLPYTAYSFKHIKNKIFAFSCEFTPVNELKKDNSFPSVYIYDFDSKEHICDQFFSDKLRYSELMMTSNNLNPYYLTAYSQKIYEVTPQGLTALVNFEYPTKEKDALNDLFESLEKKSNESSKITDEAKSQIPILYSFFNLDNVIFFSLMKGSVIYYNFYYKQTKELIQCVGIGKMPIKDDIRGNLIFAPYASEKDNFICIASPEQLKGTEGFENVDDMNNPILVKLQIKKEDAKK